jgi:hypothetical protein
MPNPIQQSQHQTIDLRNAPDQNDDDKHAELKLRAGNLIPEDQPALDSQDDQERDDGAMD